MQQNFLTASAENARCNLEDYSGTQTIPRPLSWYTSILWHDSSVAVSGKKMQRKEKGINLEKIFYLFADACVPSDDG